MLRLVSLFCYDKRRVERDNFCFFILHYLYIDVNFFIMDPQKRYKLLFSEIIAKQAVILGPTVAVIKARNVPGLTVDDKGNVLRVEGDYQEALERLVDEYVNLSGQIIKSALVS